MSTARQPSKEELNERSLHGVSLRVHRAIKSMPDWMQTLMKSNRVSCLPSEKQN